jgi:hypothetical protein
MKFCLGATVGRQIGDPCKMHHQAAKSADSMLLNLPHCSKCTIFIFFYKILLLLAILHSPHYHVVAWCDYTKYQTQSAPDPG